MEAEDLLEEPYSFGECHSKTCFAKANSNAWAPPEHDIKVHIRRSGDFVEILLPELIWTNNVRESLKDIITLDLNLLDSELESFLGKNRVGREFMGLGMDNRTIDLGKREMFPCTITLTRNGKIHIAPSDECFGFYSHKTGLEVGIFSTVLSFIPDDSEPEIPSEPETKKAAT